MTPVSVISGVAVPYGAHNVDTDQIIDGSALKTVTREGLGARAFAAVRRDPGNVFDEPRHVRAPILVAGANFGCGSSREHAPWALADMGFRAVIAQGFADIFAGNAAKNGLLLVPLAPSEIEHLLAVARRTMVTIDLATQIVRTDLGDLFDFDIDPLRKQFLLAGTDEIDFTLSLADEIRAYETARALARPWMTTR